MMKKDVTYLVVILMDLWIVANTFTIPQFQSLQKPMLTQSTRIDTILITKTQLNAKLNNDDDYLTNMDERKSSSLETNRRTILRQSTLAILSTLPLVSNENANAFPNKISTKYDDRPKRRGPQPKDLNLLPTRKTMEGDTYVGLKQCGAAPNCFSSTDLLEEDPEHVIPSWKWNPASIKTKEEAFQQLYDVIQKYEPGQSNIDGGGFQIVEFDLSKGYIYAQFESLKNGYIDDFELAYLNDAVQVRSSSRVGYLDFGVNAKRINYIAKRLRDLGWDAEGVDPKTHQDYVIQNSSA